MSLHRLNLFKPESFVHKYRLEIGLTLVGLGLLAIGVSGVMSLVHSYDTRFYPGTLVDSLSVAGLTKDQAHQKIAATATVPTYKIILALGKNQIASSSAELGLSKNIDASLDTAFAQTHQQPLWIRAGQVLGWRSQITSVTSPWTFSPAAITQALAQLQAASSTLPQEPTATLITTGKATTLKIFSGKAGQAINVDTAVAIVNQVAIPIPQGDITVASSSALVDLSAAQETTGHQLTTDEMTQLQTRAKNLVGKTITFTGDDQTQTITDQQLVSWLAWPTGYRSGLILQTVAQWQTQMTRPPQNAVFEYNPTTLAVSKFTPPQDGLALDANATASQLQNDIQQLEQTSQTHLDEKLALTITHPDTTLSSTNDIGINEVIGTGDSKYQHSIPSRIHNVQITSDKLNNTLVKPGAEFSFNQTIGDVSADTGYQPAYIIMNGATILGDGGGVCQVSSTLFRALLNAGVKITRRIPHSYRVSYYELNSQPGFDATVYSGNVDLRFINDTDHYLLIHSEADSKNLYMKITLYGTSDGRTTEITNYKSWDAQPAPPPQYTVDPTLPHGVTKQTDFAAAGIKTTFTNVIKDKSGNVIREDTYNSNYIPWAAKYLVGP